MKLSSSGNATPPDFSNTARRLTQASTAVGNAIGKPRRKAVTRRLAAPSGMDARRRRTLSTSAAIMPRHPYAEAAPRLPEGKQVDPRTLVESAGRSLELEIGPGRGGFAFERLAVSP